METDSSPHWLSMHQLARLQSSLLQLQQLQQQQQQQQQLQIEEAQQKERQLLLSERLLLRSGCSDNEELANPAEKDASFKHPATNSCDEIVSEDDNETKQDSDDEKAEISADDKAETTRTSPAILHSTLSNIIKIFMHKSAMQLQAREMQRTSGVTAAAVMAGGAAAVGANSGGVSGGGAEVKPHQCQQCLKSFSSNHQLVQHIRVHTGEKPYKCSYCERRFKQLSHVQQHTRLHTGERPYKCHFVECGRAFIQLSNLQQHLRNHDAQLERMKNRPFHCQICGKGFATESSLRTHTTKHAALIGGPNAVNCPICNKMLLGGSALMEHMKHVHKDPNASGVAAKRRTPNHPCPICGKQYVNEGSLRKHMATHPETAGLASPLRMWPCSVCQAVFTHESAFLTHMDRMRMDPKHQFAAQYVLSRAAAERRERETFLAAAAAAVSTSMAMGSAGAPGMGNSIGIGAGNIGGADGALTIGGDTGHTLQPHHHQLSHHPHGHHSHNGRHHMFGGVQAMLATAGMPSSVASPSALSDSSSRISTPADSAKVDARQSSSSLAAAAAASFMADPTGVVNSLGGAAVDPTASFRLDMLSRLQYGGSGSGVASVMAGSTAGGSGGGGSVGLTNGTAVSSSANSAVSNNSTTSGTSSSVNMSDLHSAMMNSSSSAAAAAAIAASVAPSINSNVLTNGLLLGGSTNTGLVNSISGACGSTLQQHQQLAQQLEQPQHPSHHHHIPQQQQQLQQQQSSRCLQSVSSVGNNMRSVIQQNQAELVKSTLCSQAESARSLDMLRSLSAVGGPSLGTNLDGATVGPMGAATGNTTGAGFSPATMTGSAASDLRALQADLALRHSGHEMHSAAAAAVAAVAAGLQPAGSAVDHSQYHHGQFRLSDTLRFHHDARATSAFGFLNNAQHN